MIALVLRELGKIVYWIVFVFSGGLLGIPFLIKDETGLPLTQSVGLAVSGIGIIAFLMTCVALWRVASRLKAASEGCLNLSADVLSASNNDLFRQNDAIIEAEMQLDGTWKTRSEIEIEVIGEDPIENINHWNVVGSSYSKRFASFEASGKVISSSRPIDVSFECKARTDDHGAFDMMFSISPPLRKGDILRYAYYEDFSGAVPVTLDQLVSCIGNRASHNDVVQITRGYTILCETKKLRRVIRFPKGYRVQNPRFDISFRGNRARTEEARVQSDFEIINKDGQISIVWEVENPLTGFDYFIRYTPPKEETLPDSLAGSEEVKRKGNHKKLESLK